MFTTAKRPTLDDRAGRFKSLQYYNRPSHITKPKKKFQGEKQHWSRRPRQRELDRALLALFSLAFRKVPGTTCHRLGRRMSPLKDLLVNILADGYFQGDRGAKYWTSVSIRLLWGRGFDRA